MVNMFLLCSGLNQILLILLIICHFNKFSPSNNVNYREKKQKRNAESDLETQIRKKRRKEMQSQI